MVFVIVDLHKPRTSSLPMIEKCGIGDRKLER
jgi:hypothetical protein